MRVSYPHFPHFPLADFDDLHLIGLPVGGLDIDDLSHRMAHDCLPHRRIGRNNIVVVAAGAAACNAILGLVVKLHIQKDHLGSDRHRIG